MDITIYLNRDHIFELLFKQARQCLKCTFSENEDCRDFSELLVGTQSDDGSAMMMNLAQNQAESVYHLFKMMYVLVPIHNFAHRFERDMKRK